MDILSFETFPELYRVWGDHAVSPTDVDGVNDETNRSLACSVALVQAVQLFFAQLPDTTFLFLG